MDGNLTPHDVDDLLRELVRRLQQSDLAAGIRVVGGAAIALMNDQRRTTRDIDAALHPADVVKAAAADVALARPAGGLAERRGPGLHPAGRGR